MRTVEAGCFASIAAGRIGLGTRLPPQFGQLPCSVSASQLVQKVHSKVQISASVESGGTDNGPPGYRTDYDPGYYGAFLLDPDRNRIEAMWLDPARRGD